MEEIKRIPIKLTFTKFIIHFEYTTKGKGYYRRQARTIMAIDKSYAIKDFKLWAKEQRTMVNAQILTIVETEETKFIEL